MNRSIAILGIHTDIGKTITSAVIAEALDADYWKPVQAGNLDSSDSLLVKSLLSDGTHRVHEEAIKLSQPMSPHAAAKIDGVEIDYTKFKWPETDKLLLVETAGGILSPMTDTATMADFTQHYKLPAILASKNYLGSINHTLLSIEVLKNRGIKILGLVINGEPNTASEQYIEQYSKVPIIARMPFFENLDSKAIKAQAAIIKDSLLQHLENAGY